MTCCKMLGPLIKIKQLPTDKELLTSGTTDISHLQNFLNAIHIENEEDVEHLLKHIVAIIDGELNFPQRDDGSFTGIQFNQATVNAAFRLYYQLLRKYNRMDQRFHSYYCSTANGGSKQVMFNDRDYIMQYYVLLTVGDEHFEPLALRDACVKKFALAVDNNETSLLTIIKTLNVIFKKWPDINASLKLTLEHVYFCLQSNQLGMRDEMMDLLKHVCACKETSFLYFAHIVRFWPWTNRSKLFMLGCILKKQKLEELLQACGFCRADFFNGLRSTLNFKSLLACSQYVIQALSSQSSPDLLHLALDILAKGPAQELRNFYAHWFSRIQANDELFQMVVQENSVFTDTILNNDCIHLMPPLECYRTVLVFSMFSKEILQQYPHNYKAFLENVIRNCLQTALDTQLLIIKLIIENMANTPLGSMLDFFNVFLQKHMLVENAQFRNTVLGCMPTIINHLAKTYSRNCLQKQKGYLHVVDHRILNFFQSLQNDVEMGICNSLYQPKIFGLKLLDILMKSLYGKNIRKNAKNCSLTQNQQLGEFLKEHKVLNFTGLLNTLMHILNDPSGFDDAMDLTVNLIVLIQPDEKTVDKAFQIAFDCCAIEDIDKANLSCLYAKVAVESCRDSSKHAEIFLRTFIDIKKKLYKFEKDPLYACKSEGSHLFSSLNVLNVLILHSPEISTLAVTDLLLEVETIETTVLTMMNKCNVKESCHSVNAASFEDLDKSLEILVSSSEYSSVDHENSRKYLLMTFWLTLKACCELSASIVKFLISAATREMESVRVTSLRRCLQINVDVLTKCRHKGAIEAAGCTIGACTQSITSQFAMKSEEYGLLHSCLKNLYDAHGSEVSTTRRGAGFSIMFLHILKNEAPRSRPLLTDAIQNLMKSSKSSSKTTPLCIANCDRIEALHLHYLCVLVRDTQLKDAVSNFYNEIMIAAILQIDNSEWTVCNGALQLFGSLVPKIVGQRQATEFEESLPWDPSEVTFCEVTRKLRIPFEYILKYCFSEKCSTRSIILFLEFLHKVEYIHKSSQPESLEKFRELIWRLLSHHCEKVRILAAKCFVRSHEFSMELPEALKNIASILFAVQNENFFQGLTQTLLDGISKLQHDSKFVIPLQVQQEQLQHIRSILCRHFVIKHPYKLYSICKLWDMLKLIEVHKENPNVLDELRNLPILGNDNMSIGIDLWQQRIHVD